MKLPGGRNISYAVAGLLCVVGVFFLITAYRYRQDFYRWQEASPIDIAIDLSKPGQFTGGFKQTCHIAHGEVLCLRLPPNMLANSAWPNRLHDLRFVAQIRDKNGMETVREEFTGDLFGTNYQPNGTLALLPFPPFGNGEYQLILTVTEGVPALQGTPQRLVARYMLCGLEMMPAFIVMGMGIGSFALAGIIALITALIVRRHGDGEILP